MFTAQSLAEDVRGQVVSGPPDRVVSGVAELDSATTEELSFFANPRYLDAFNASSAAVILVGDDVNDHPSATLIRCPDPYLALSQIATRFAAQDKPKPGIHPTAAVDPEAQLGHDVVIGACAVVESDARIGDGTILAAQTFVGRGASIGRSCHLFPGAKVLSRCSLGQNVVLHPGVVVGSDGFGFAPDANGMRHKIPQIGVVIVEDDVEIGANSTIDRATFGETRIGARSKLDNLVQIGHNVRLGPDSVIVAQSGIAGSAQLGKRLIVGAQAGIAGHVHVVDDVTLAARAGVTGNVTEPGIYSGMPVQPIARWRKMIAVMKSLPDLRKRVRALEHDKEKE